MPVPEYMIRTHDYDWPAFHRERHDAVLIPSGSAWEQVDGWGDFRMAKGDDVVAFSGEMTGWQVIVEEGDMSDEEMDTLIETITAQVAEEVGVPCEWIRTS